jgi:hypothetical protein
MLEGIKINSDKVKEWSSTRVSACFVTIRCKLGDEEGHSLVRLSSMVG